MKIVSLLSALLLLPVLVSAEVKEIDNAKLTELLAQNVPIVDVRRAEEWQQTGIVAGSHLLTFFDVNGNYDARSWLAQLAAIAEKDDPVILICRTGRRTGLISKFMEGQVGYSNVYNVTKGITHWIGQGNPVVAP